MNATADSIKEPLMENAKLRIGMDIATIGFMLGLAFNAGVQYNRINDIDIAQQQNRDNINKIRQDEEPLSERVARMEAILQDIRDELKDQNDRNTAK